MKEIDKKREVFLMVNELLTPALERAHYTANILERHLPEVENPVKLRSGKEVDKAYVIDAFNRIKKDLIELRKQLADEFNFFAR